MHERLQVDHELPEVATGGLRQAPGQSEGAPRKCARPSIDTAVLADTPAPCSELSVTHSAAVGVGVTRRKVTELPRPVSHARRDMREIHSGACTARIGWSATMTHCRGRSGSIGAPVIDRSMRRGSSREQLPCSHNAHTSGWRQEGGRGPHVDVGSAARDSGQSMTWSDRELSQFWGPAYGGCGTATSHRLGTSMACGALL